MTKTSGGDRECVIHKNAYWCGALASTSWRPPEKFPVSGRFQKAPCGLFTFLEEIADRGLWSRGAIMTTDDIDEKCSFCVPSKRSWMTNKCNQQMIKKNSRKVDGKLLLLVVILYVFFVPADRHGTAYKNLFFFYRKIIDFCNLWPIKYTEWQFQICNKARALGI